MEYQTYTTDALVLGGIAKGEANKRLVLLTRTFGVVRADVQRVRDTRSKLRYALQQYSLARVSLVYGKGGWRVVNAVPRFSFWARFRRTPSRTRHAAARLSLISRRLMVAEEVHTNAFFIVYEAWSALASSTLTSADADAIEGIAVARLLYDLGYLAPTKQVAPFLAGGVMTRERAASFRAVRADAVAAINASLEATQLM